MTTETKKKSMRPLRFIARRFRELIYMLTSFPVLLTLFVLVTMALSTGAFIPLAIIVLLGLLAAMEFIARFEVGRTNTLLKSDLRMSEKNWFESPFFSWDGAKERATSLRSWLAIGYVFLAFGLAILGFAFSCLAIAAIISLVAALGLIALHPRSGSFAINSPDFNGNFGINFGPKDFQVHFLGFDINDGPINGQFHWSYNSPLNTVLSIFFLLLAIAMVPLIAKWQKNLVLRFLSDRSYAELFYNSDSRRRTAVSVGTQDRSRIEKDLHDGVQARLTVTGMEIDRARLLAEKSEDKEVIAALERAAEETSSAMQEIRNIVKGLRPALLEKAGLEAALNSLGSKQTFKVAITAPSARLGLETESAIYLICSEAMTNVGRHSKATEMSIVILQKGKLITLDIEDNGIGGAHQSDGTGLKNMKGRAESLGGEFILMSPAGGPTHIKVIVPCE